MIVRYGDSFRLRFVARKRGAEPLYLISAEKGGREFYPRMGSDAGAAVLLRFSGGRAGEPVSSRGAVELSTTEGVVGEANTLGAWKGDHFLYYHPPGKPEQRWQIDVGPQASNDGKLHAGEDFVLVSSDDSNRRMGQDQRQPDYLTADYAAPGWFRIEIVP